MLFGNVEITAQIKARTPSIVDQHCNQIASDSDFRETLKTHFHGSFSMDIRELPEMNRSDLKHKLRVATAALESILAMAQNTYDDPRDTWYTRTSCEHALAIIREAGKGAP